MACKILPPQTIKGQWDSNRLSAYRASWKSSKKIQQRSTPEMQPRGEETGSHCRQRQSCRSAWLSVTSEITVTNDCVNLTKSGFLFGNSSSCKTEMSHSTLQKPTSNKMWGVVWEGGCRKAGGERVRTATAAARQDRRWPTPGANQTTCTFRKNSFSLNSDVFWHTVQIKHMCKITQKHTIVYGGKYRNTFDLH